MTYLDEYLEELRYLIRNMTRKQKIYTILKEELNLLGYWKNKSRGNPAEGYKVSRNAKKEVSPS